MTLGYHDTLVSTYVTESEVIMATSKKKKSEKGLEDVARKFLEENPEAQRALDLFGIAFEEYEQSLAAQVKPVFSTGTSAE